LGSIVGTQVGFDNARMAANLIGASPRDHGPKIQDGNLATKVHDQSHVVFDDQDR
jgi:hypothetical protein